MDASVHLRIQWAIEVLKRIRLQNRDPQPRTLERIVQSLLPIAEQVASQFLRSRAYLDEEEVRAEARIALLLALHDAKIDRGDIRRFLYLRVERRLFDYIRREASLKRNEARKANRIERLIGDLRQRLKREPDAQEKADAIGTTLEDFHRFEARRYLDLPTPVENQNSSVPVSLLQKRVQKEIRSLREPNQQIADLFFLQEQTPKEISTQLRLKLGTVERVIRSTRTLLRKRIER